MTPNSNPRNLSRRRIPWIVPAALFVLLLAGLAVLHCWYLVDLDVQTPPSPADTEMFQLALVTFIVTLGLCLLAVIGFVYRETVGERRRRQNERLAFGGVVASSIIHDLRNCMSPMRLDAQMLEQEAARGPASRPERMNELAQRVDAAIHQLDILLIEFLEITRPEVIEHERFDLNVALREAMAMLKPQYEKAGIRLEPELAEQPLFIRGFPVQFKRAMVNILNNATHFAPAGSAVTVRSRPEDERAIVEIADQGPGIPARNRRHVFDLFFTTRPTGSGLGLALTKTAVENCGGKVSVRPGPADKGACFVVRVPLDRQKNE